MEGIAYLNGAYLDAADAKVSIFDRAVLFGDAVYEVAGVLDGRLLDFSGFSGLNQGFKSIGIRNRIYQGQQTNHVSPSRCGSLARLGDRENLRKDLFFFGFNRKGKVLKQLQIGCSHRRVLFAKESSVKLLKAGFQRFSRITIAAQPFGETFKGSRSPPG